MNACMYICIYICYIYIYVYYIPVEGARESDAWMRTIPNQLCFGTCGRVDYLKLSAREDCHTSVTSATIPEFRHGGRNLDEQNLTAGPNKEVRNLKMPKVKHQRRT